MVTAPAGAAIALVQDLPQSGTSVTSLGGGGLYRFDMVVPAGGVASGTTIIVIEHVIAPGFGATPTDSRSNTYTLAVQAKNGTPSIASAIYYSTLTTSLLAGDKISFTTSGTSIAGGSVSDWSGLASTTPVDQTTYLYTATSVAAGTFTTSTVTTTQADELLISGCWDRISSGTAASLSLGSGYTSLDAPTTTIKPTTVACLSEYEIVSATGSYAGSFTTTDATTSRCIVLATFKAAAGGGAARRRISGSVVF